jgi:adenylosuccinate lyase
MSHERDISHSSVERMIGPDSTITLDFALARLTGVIDKLLVYPERMLANAEAMGGLISSQRILLALTQAGLSREDSYRLVQRNAMKVWDNYQARKPVAADQFMQELKQDEDVGKALSAEQIEREFDMATHTRHVDTIFKRVFGDAA